MSLELYLVFVVATALLIATPGPNVALIVGTSLTHGARTGLIAMAGVNLGVMVQLVVVAAGLSWIVELFAKNFDIIRFEFYRDRDIAFEGRGCALSRAAASIMTTMVHGRTTDASRDLAAAFERFVQSAPDAAVPEELGELRAFAGVRRFRSRRVCALLGFRALLRALDPST